MKPKKNYTAANFLKALDKDLLNENLNTVFSRLRGTEAFWKIPRNNLRVMMEEYGPATFFFLTVSPGEWMWPELAEFIKTANNWSNEKSISELFALDPVSTAIFFQKKT